LKLALTVKLTFSLKKLGKIVVAKVKF